MAEQVLRRTPEQRAKDRAGQRAKRARDRAKRAAEGYTPSPRVTPASIATQFKPGQSGNPAGGKKLTVPASALPIITKLAAKGVRQRDIGRAIGVSQQVWNRQREAQPEVADALAAGQQKMHDALVHKLYEKAVEGDTVSLLFLLKCRFGYREGDELNSDSKPQVIINLPGAAQDIASYAKGITIEAQRALPTSGD